MSNSVGLSKYLTFVHFLNDKKSAPTSYQKWRLTVAEAFTVNHKASISGSRFKRLRRKLAASAVSVRE